ncbi:MAG: hypothetical protein KDD12_19705 [Lewinella sp.]|nr:hypothetical protein [Lewinella sp.]
MADKSIYELRSLAEIITAHKLKSLSFPLLDSNPNNLHELYNLISAGNLTSTAEVEDHFFSKLSNSAIYATRLQRKLRESLLDTLFLIDSSESGFNALQKNYYKCYRNLIAVKILNGRYQRAAAIPIAERTIKKAIHFEISDVVIELAKDLRFHYGGIIGDKNKWKYYHKLVEEWRAKHQTEVLIEGYYLDIMCNFILSKSTKKEFSRVVDQHLASIEGSMRSAKTFRSTSYYFMLKVLKFEIVNDFANVLTVSEEALAFFDTKKELVTGPTRFIFNKNLLISYTRLRKFHLAEAAARRCMKLVTPGSLNWYNTCYLSIVLYFQSGKFEEAHALWQLAVTHANFKNIPDSNKETWRIIEASIQFFMLTGRIDSKDDQKTSANFRVNRFLNEVPAFSKDKRGNNINILILHVLYLIQSKRYNEIHDRVESLRVYSSRYLRKDDMFRSNCFIRMLMCLPAGHFHLAAVKRKAAPFVEKLKTVPYAKADQPIEIEIIPYETLWEIVLEKLDKRIR